MQHRAMDILEQARLQNIGMIEAIRRDSAEILTVEGDAVLLRDKRSGAYMLYAAGYEPGRLLLKQLAVRNDVRELTVNRADLCRLAERLLPLALNFEFYHVAYFEDRSPVPTQRLEIHIPPEELADRIDAAYPHLDREGVLEHIRTGRLYAGFWKGEFIGFIGEHPEGSIGLLEIFPEYRRRGFAYDLESFMILLHYSQGKIPFAQVFVDNEKSLSLQRKLGMDIAGQSCFWLSALPR